MSLEQLQSHPEYREGMKIWDVTRQPNSQDLKYWHNPIQGGSRTDELVYEEIIKEVGKKIQDKYELILP